MTDLYAFDIFCFSDHTYGQVHFWRVYRESIKLLQYLVDPEVSSNKNIFAIKKLNLYDNLIIFQYLLILEHF